MAAVATMRPLSRPSSGPLQPYPGEARRAGTNASEGALPVDLDGEVPESVAAALRAEKEQLLLLNQQQEQQLLLLRQQKQLLLQEQQQQQQQLQQQQQQQPASGESEPQTYNAERVIGTGTFGIVYSAHVVETDETVAIKKVFVDKRYRNRELQVWTEMRHPNIVELKNAFYTSGDSPDELYLNMVMEFVPETVYCVMKRYCKQRLPMPRVLVHLYTFQACRALAHLHASSIVHRDIKPQNLLVDASRGHLLKLCDFGSATRISQSQPKRTTLVAYICSRYYRAPELIFGSVDYTAAVDLWSIGCVLAEMLRGRPLFPGENGVDQLVEIVKVLGSPTREQVIAMNPQYLHFQCPPLRPSGWRTVFRRDVGTRLLDLLASFLRYDPRARVRPLEACAHDCFDDLRDERTRCPEGHAFPPDLFHLTRDERRACSPELLQKILPARLCNPSGGCAVAADASPSLAAVPTPQVAVG